MSERTVRHDTMVVERIFKASRKRVFAALADPNALRVWKVPNDEWKIGEFESDFRIGGREKSCFGPPGDARYCNEGIYLDIVPEERIVSAGTMHDGGARMSATLCTIELFAEGSGSRLVLTDQSAFFDGREKPEDRRSGWGTIVDRLAAYLEDESSKA